MENQTAPPGPDGRRLKEKACKTAIIWYNKHILNVGRDQIEMSQTYTMVMLLVLVGMMAFIYFRENKQKKKAQAMWDSLKKGDVITTIGGIVGKIVAVNERTIIIETSEDRVRMELLKTAVNVSSLSENAEPKKSGKEEEKKAEALPETTEKETEK